MQGTSSVSNTKVWWSSQLQAVSCGKRRETERDRNESYSSWWESVFLTSLIILNTSPITLNSCHSNVLLMMTGLCESFSIKLRSLFKSHQHVHAHVKMAFIPWKNLKEMTDFVECVLGETKAGESFWAENTKMFLQPLKVFSLWRCGTERIISGARLGMGDKGEERRRKREEMRRKERRRRR